MNSLEFSLGILRGLSDIQQMSGRVNSPVWGTTGLNRDTDLETDSIQILLTALRLEYRETKLPRRAPNSKSWERKNKTD